MSKKIVKSCKNCTIGEVWALFVGKPSDFPEHAPYGLHNSVAQHLKTMGDEHSYDSYLYKGNPMPKRYEKKCPPFYNAEIWGRRRKFLVRTGHQFFAFHMQYTEQQPYQSYNRSYENELKKVLTSIDHPAAFEVTELKLCYHNNFQIESEKDGKFAAQKYFNAAIAYNQNAKPFPSLDQLSFSYAFEVRDKVFIQLTNSLQEENRSSSKLRTHIRTIGHARPLPVETKLNDPILLKQILDLKSDIKNSFFDLLSQHTKDNIMEVKYE